jgi:hypothetical protein
MGVRRLSIWEVVGRICFTRRRILGINDERGWDWGVYVTGYEGYEGYKGSWQVVLVQIMIGGRDTKCRSWLGITAQAFDCTRYAQQMGRKVEGRSKNYKHSARCLGVLGAERRILFKLERKRGLSRLWLLLLNK